jgi:CheY-like chemotaxis protein
MSTNEIEHGASDNDGSKRDRRDRRRAKITASVRVRSMNSIENFDAVGKTIDVSRDGLLLTARYGKCEKGQLIEVAFPYSNEPPEQIHWQAAEVVRVSAQPHGKFAIALHFLAAKRAAGQLRESERRATAMHYDAGAHTSKATNTAPPVILAVEPDLRVAATMRTIVEQKGYLLVVVNNGRQAVEFLDSSVPDVLIAGIDSEDVSGLDLCRLTKSDERLARVQVILLTNSAQSADYVESEKLGALVCMAGKPERLQQLISSIAPPPTSRGAYDAGMPANTVVDRT